MKTRNIPLDFSFDPTLDLPGGSTFDLAIDPALTQLYADRAVATENLIPRTPSDMRLLKAKRDFAIKESHKVTREQRRRDMTIKLLKPDETVLSMLRKMETSNYFCVPYDQTRAVRAVIFRESKTSDKQYTTAKFKWAHHAYLKVKRVI